MVTDTQILLPLKIKVRFSQKPSSNKLPKAEAAGMITVRVVVLSSFEE